MGHVALGRDILLGRLVAIKVLKPEMASAANAERFTREARNAARLKHPNVVQVHRADEAAGLFYYTMDYVEWRTLADWLARGPLPPLQVVRLGDELLAGLAAAHAHHLIHRDVKPSNIFFSGDRAMLSDFGIAYALDSSRTELTAPGELVGTPAYVSPEQLHGGEIRAQTDLYAVGLVLYEAVTGRRWMPGSDPEKGDWSRVPEPLRAPLRRALRIAQAERWASADEFAAALMEAGAGLSGGAARRQRTAGWIGAGLVAAAAIALVVSGRRRAPPAARDLVIVPFTAAGLADSGIGPRLSGLTGWSIERQTDLRLVPRQIAFRQWRRSAESPAHRLEQLTKTTDSRYGAWAIVRPHGPLLEVQLRVIATDGKPLLERSVTGDSANLPGLGDAVALTITESLFSARQRTAPDGLARVPRAARVEFLLGEDAFARDAWLTAERHYQRAYELDSSFVLAGWRLGNTRRWLPLRVESPFPAGLWQRYQQNRDALPEMDRYLIEAQFRPSGERFESYERALRVAGDDPSAALLFGDELFHRGPLAGRPLRDAVGLLERAVAIDPSLAPAWEHLTWALIRLGERDRAAAALSRLEQLAAPREESEIHLPTFLRIAYDWRFGSKGGDERRAALLGSPGALALAARGALSFGLAAAQAELGAALSEAAETADLRASGLIARGVALFALGRPQAALAALDSASVLFSSPAEARLQAAEWRVIPPALGMPGIGQGERDRGRAVLRALAADSLSGHRAAFALALDAYARGDTAAVETWGARVRHATGAGQRLLPLVDALEHGARSSWDAALALSEAGLASDSVGYAPDPFFRSALHLLRGEWLANEGRPLEADRSLLWYENLDVIGWPHAEAQPAEVDWALGSFARLRRARLAAADERSADACALARGVAEVWGDAEPAVLAYARTDGGLEVGCSQ
jgi:tetratricopeptide (TPR) repeat protein